MADPNKPVDPNEEPIEISMDVSDDTPSMINTGQISHKDEKQYQRSPNATGQGAIRVKTFHAKIRDDALEYMDEQINQWLDEHPEYEVKFATSTIGELIGKTRELALIVNVWI